VIRWLYIEKQSGQTERLIHHQGVNRHRGSVTIHNKKESTVDFHRNLTGVECSFGAL